MLKELSDGQLLPVGIDKFHIIRSVHGMNNNYIYFTKET